MIAAIKILLISSIIGAQPDGSYKYPPPHCAPPHFEVLPQAEESQAPDQARAGFYEYEVRQYNREVEAYGACIRNYIAKANREAQRIQADAAKEAKRITDTASSSAAVIRAQIRRAAASAKKMSDKPAGPIAGVR